MSSVRTALVLAAMMCAASVGAMLARPDVKMAEQGPQLVLEATIPEQFGGWRVEPQTAVQVINPQTQQLLDKFYSQILTRVYVNDGGYRIMLSVAYGGDQREGLRAHKPEVCYPAQGFTLKRSDAHPLATPFGTIAARRMLAAREQRQEPVTYWHTIGGRSVDGGVAAKLAEIRVGLTGRIPDGLLFRVSSIDPDPARAWGRQEEFVRQLLATVPPEERLRLSGLGMR